MYYTLPWRRAQLILQVDNLFDAKAPVSVYSDSGTPDYTIQQFDAAKGSVGGLNTLDDYYYRPQYYSAPRSVSLGFKIDL